MTAQGSFKALLIGNGRFELDDRLKALTGPSHDVELLRSALTNPLLGLHGAEDVQCLIDAPCAAIVDATEQFFARADTDDQLLFYYSGHGWRGRFRRLHLCARDTRVDALLSSAMSDQVLNEAIRVSPSRRVVLVLDCCFSGLVGDFASKGPESGVEFIPPSLQGEGRFVMTSCQANEPAADGPEASPFTRFFCEALTSPETDTNGDGFVTVNEVYDYILPRMLKATKQTPERSISHAVANLPLGRSARREGVRGDGSEQASQQARGTPHNLKQRVLFVGRSQEVDDVERALAGTSRATITTRASIYGFGGVGKTAIAREVAWRAVDNSTYAGGVFWVEAEGQPLRAIPTLAAALKQADVANLDLDAPAEALASATTKALASTRSPILIVLDNVDQEGWDELIPGGAVRLVVTTRNAQLAIGAPHEVEALSGDAAVQFAIEFGGASASDEVEVMRRVVTDKLGGLPVAIEVAAKAVKSSVGSWRRYEKFLDTQGTDILQQVLGAPEFKSSNYPHGVFAALAGSVKNSSEVARRFLDAAIVFAPENVPVSWIVEAAGWERDSFEVSRAITELGNRSLVKWNKTEDAISMHRLVHACGREVAERKEWAATNRRGARCVRSWLDRVIDTSKPAEIELMREHVREALRAADLAEDVAMWVELADHLGTHLRNRGLFGESRSWLETCLSRLEQSLGSDSKALVLILVNLGTLLNVSGAAAEARPLFERALAISVASLGDNHPTVAVRLADLATSFSRLGMGDRALPLLERAVEIASIAFGPEHPRVASCLADLGALLVNDLGLPVRARPVLERALHIYETTSGVQHPALVILLVNLANAMSRDERDAARKFLERAVEIASAPIQRPWWELSTDLRNLGRALIRFGMESIAQTMLKRALVLDQGISANHPAVASDLWLLAVVCLSRGERAAACPFLEQAYAILDGSLGSNHPDTVKVQRALQRLREDLPGNTGPL